MKNIPLYQQIYNYFYERIKTGVLKANDQIPTEKELMDQFLVSRITVKNAINKLNKDGYVTRIPGKGTFVNAEVNISNGVLPKKKLIGLVLCDIDYTFGIEILTSIETELTHMGYHMIFKRTYESKESELQALKDLITLGVEGIIIQTVHGEIYSDDVLRIYLSGFPIVFIDRHMEKTSVPVVTTNNYQAARSMTKRLMLAGYKNIAFVSSDPKGTSSLEKRFEGFKDVYHKKETNILDLETPTTRVKTKENVTADLDKIKKLFERHPDIDCIFAAEMFVAQLSKTALKQMGLRTPQDVGIVTFDTDTLNSKHAYFTHIKQNQVKMGKEAVQILTSSINRRETQRHKKVYIDADIFIGKTTIDI